MKVENSIEEDIKIAERFIKSIKTDKEYKKEGWHGYFNEEIVELARILEHILKELKRLENMYEAEKRIHMVRNEQLARKQQLVIKCNELENENKELKKDISNMYDEEVIISIISDNFNLSRNEVLKLLGGE